MGDAGSARGPGPYALGVDLGTTYTAAAVYRGGQVTMVDLATRSTVAPSVVLVRSDGSALFGETADRRALVEPTFIAREFKRRLGDTVPILLGGAPHSAHSLGARLLAWVIVQVSELEGGPPSVVAVTHPANWGPYKQEVFGQLLDMAGLPAALRLTEPEAAAIAYAADERPPPDAHLAVYDLGGGTFDTVVLRRQDNRFDLVGEPGGIEQLGGVDFDEALYHWVWGQVGGASASLDLANEVVRRDLLALRRECVGAKEALSSDTEAVVPVRVGALQAEVVISRPAFEELIRPTLGSTIVALERVVAGADLTPDELHAVLLVGGSSRIPLVTELIEESLGRPVALDVHPKHVVARGAALVAGAALARGSSTATGQAASAAAAVRPVGPPPAPRVTATPTLPPPSPPPATPGPIVAPAPAPAVASTAPAAAAVPAATVATISPPAEPTKPAAVPLTYTPPTSNTRVAPILIVLAVIAAGLGLGIWLARHRQDDTTTTSSSSTTLTSSSDTSTEASGSTASTTTTTAGTSVTWAATTPGDTSALTKMAEWQLVRTEQAGAIQAAAGAGAAEVVAKCAEAVRATETRFGKLPNGRPLQVPADLDDALSGLTSAELRNAYLNEIDLRVRTWRTCADGNRSASKDLETKANDALDRIRVIQLALSGQTTTT